METKTVTLLLRRIADGDPDAEGALYGQVYSELRDRARRILGPAASAATLQATALVHEAWIKLQGPATASWNDRAHFLRVASRAMRSVLVDHARARRTQKRGGERGQLALDDILAAYEERALDLIALDDALERLAGFDEQLAQVVELRFFAGLGIAETARVIGVSPSTIERAWRTARTWLRAEL